MTIRVRYAPSPTGHLHIGGVRTSLFNYLLAKHEGGDFILRSEDTDLERNVPGAEEEILRGFRWLGFDWSEGPDVGGPYGPYRCTDRLDIYTKHLEKLAASDWAYPCFCTPEELEADREKMLQAGQVPRYSGKCRHLTPAQREEKLRSGLTPNWRLKIPAGLTLELDDLVRGHVTFYSDDVGDFVIVKSNGIPTYNFQVVIDDVLMKITHVIRGEEHLSNTPRQLLVYRAFGYEPPLFGHLPQVLDQTRKKLSKRDPNVMPVMKYRELGYLPEAIVNFLALLGWSPGGEEEIMSMETITLKFTMERVNKSGAIFDVDKLRWMSQQYMKSAPMERLLPLVQEQLKSHNIPLPEGRDSDWLQDVITLYQEKMVCAADFVSLARGFFNEEIEWEPDALAILKEPGAASVVRRYVELCDDAAEWTADASKARFKQVGQELGAKGKGLFMPVRSAVMGSVHGPDLQLSIASLPKDWVRRRAERALQLISGTI